MMRREKQKIKEIIVVEGKYDKNTVSQIVDTLVIETSGFQVFSDREKMNLIKKLAKARGIIILTDSDSAGFVIRNHIKGCVAPELIKHAYIPDIFGKEKRKTIPSKEGKLGVEGMPPDVILEALRRAGATFENNDADFDDDMLDRENAQVVEKSKKRADSDFNNDKWSDFKSDIESPDSSSSVSKSSDLSSSISVIDLYRVGLTGKAGSANKRKKLLQALNLPEKMSSSALLDVLNVLFTKSAFDEYLADLFCETEFSK